MSDFVIGYGSLINQNSRRKSSPSSYDAVAVTIKGFTRGWFARTGVVGFSTTYLGCLKSTSDLLTSKPKSDFINGVLYKVDSDELKILDKRERRYIRTLVPCEDVSGYNSEIPSNANFWIYENEFQSESEFKESFPTKEFPIIQSYVDMCLEGCIEIDLINGNTKFSKDFLQTTFGWNTNWANDRVFPRRPQSSCKYAYEIDDLLVAYLGEEIFESIYIE